MILKHLSNWNGAAFPSDYALLLFQICENLSGFVMVARVRHIGNQKMEEGTLERRRRRKNEEEGGVSLFLTANISTRRKGSNSNMFQVEEFSPNNIS